MRAWVNQHSNEMLFDQDTFCTVVKADTPNVTYDKKCGIERANFVEQWIKANKGAEVTFGGKPWPKASGEKAQLTDFGKTYTFEICHQMAGKIMTYRIETVRSEILILQIYSRKDKLGRLRAHVRIREKGDGDMPTFLLLDH